MAQLVTDEQFEAIEKKFSERLNALNIKHKSAKAMHEQASYFAGVMTTLQELGYENAVLPIWYISVLSGRWILQERADLNARKKINTEIQENKSQLIEENQHG